MPLLYSLKWSEADSHWWHSHKLLYIIFLNAPWDRTVSVCAVFKSHPPPRARDPGQLVMTWWDSFPRMTNREFTWLPLRQGYEGLLKAYLWSTVGCVCVWERDSQVLNVCSAMCYRSQCVGVGRGWELSRNLLFFFNFLLIFKGFFKRSKPFLSISEIICLLVMLRKLEVQHFFDIAHIQHIPHFLSASHLAASL